MKILIFGAGGVGSVIGGFLARLGHDVTLLGRPWHLDVIKKNGLTITGVCGDYRIKAFELFTDAEELKKSDIDFELILLTVKSKSTQEALEAVVPLMKQNTTLLSLQDDVENVEIILKKVSAEQFLVGCPAFAAETTPGTVKILRFEGEMLIGPVPGAKLKNLSAEMTAHLFTSAKLPSKAVLSILPYIQPEPI